MRVNSMGDDDEDTTTIMTAMMMTITVTMTLCGDRVNLEVRQGQLVAVVGQVGAGKSSLLSAILGEMHKVKGSVSLRVCTVLWCGVVWCGVVW